MNQDLYESLSKKAAHLMPADRLNPYDYDMYMKILAELIVRECMRMCDVAAVGYDTHNHIKEANGCCSAKEYIAEHFGVEE
jgi:hypothetical protein